MTVSYFHFLLIIVVLFIPRGDCLSCSNCTSEISLDDCNSNATKITCQSGSSQCLTGTLTCTLRDDKKTFYYKRCSAPNTDDCETTREDSLSCPKTSPFAQSWSSFDEEDCCYGDYCNSPRSHSTALSSNRAMLGISMALTLWALAVMH
ncbi:hypothetical protein ACROYT_G027142 [Oculina patagonica]